MRIEGTYLNIIKTIYGNQRRKTNKRNPHWKEEVKHSLFADEMILYIETLKDNIKKLLELIH